MRFSCAAYLPCNLYKQLADAAMTAMHHVSAIFRLRKGGLLLTCLVRGSRFHQLQKAACRQSTSPNMRAHQSVHAAGQCYADADTE